MRKLLPLDESLPLFDVAASRTIETAALQVRPALMEDAGLAVAKLALALYPGSGAIWVAWGPRTAMLFFLVGLAIMLPAAAIALRRHPEVAPA